MTRQGGQTSHQRIGRVVSIVVSGLWLWAIPALASVAVVRHLFPSGSDPFEPSQASAVTRFAEDNSAALWAMFFLAFALVTRYWADLVSGVVPPATTPRPRRSAARRTLSFSIAIGLAAAAALLVRASFFQANQVEGSSMLPSLPLGAELGVNKLAYGIKLPAMARRARALPRRGDVIVFESPDVSEPHELVKRVVGLPGDRINVAGGRPVINGWVAPACIAGRYPVVSAEGTWIAQLLLEFLEDRTYAVLLHQGAQAALLLGEYRVKPDEVFVMGDNRPVSVDSRSWNKGRGAGVPVDSISGRVDRILVTVDQNGRLDLSRILQPLGLDLNLGGIDAQKLEENVQVCLKLRPKDTYPPKAGQSGGRNDY